jgi:regulator of nucleoside diphosphate kinase
LARGPSLQVEVVQLRDDLLVVDRHMRPLITDTDNARLRGLMSTPVARRHAASMRQLLDKLNNARIVPALRVPGSIMTMNSTAACWDRSSGASRELTLVYPWNEAKARGRVSVLSRAGVELLAAIPGQIVELDDGAKLQIAYVSHQPEAERQFHL